MRRWSRRCCLSCTCYRGFNFRGKVHDERWRTVWDWVLTCSGIVVMLISGVAFGNLFLGAPFQFDNDLRMTWSGSFFELLHPFALVAGLVSLSMLLAHGACWAAYKADHVVADRAAVSRLVRRLPRPSRMLKYAKIGRAHV